LTVTATVERITDQIGDRLPKLAIVLSTGLQAVDGDLDDPVILSYADLPGFPTTRVPSHVGRLLVGRLGGRSVVLLESHDDYYASGGIDAMREPLAVAAGLGCDKVLITAAAHSLRADLSPGQLVLVTGHVVVAMGGHGPQVLTAGLGSQYPVDWHAAYDGVLNERLRLSAARIETPLAEGCFAWPGRAEDPSPAAAREQGADMIGRSLIAEAAIARGLGLRVAALANILDWAPGCAPAGVSADLAQQRADFAAIHLRRLLADYLEHGGAD
jgi:purine nucleoside phosphorylase